ncbi:MAG: hypothetical protein CVT94_09875 [Bacteroidetes bacterium HGW-Bacteroidetes-11]|nr:MAG: hypothetical protein CVT94_09875 [Bacteroidetes bacterium HGW-Bacteroidetes-11]
MVTYLNNSTMTSRQKKMKAAAIAVSYCFLNNAEETPYISDTEWRQLGNKIAMNGRELIQRKGGDFRISK